MSDIHDGNFNKETPTMFEISRCESSKLDSSHVTRRLRHFRVFTINFFVAICVFNKYKQYEINSGIVLVVCEKCIVLKVMHVRSIVTTSKFSLTYLKDANVRLLL